MLALTVTVTTPGQSEATTNFDALGADTTCPAVTLT
jgi:hypothetical protein